MKLIEALKNLKTIEKRIEKNCTLIAEYCAYVSVETPVFETQEKQIEHVAGLVQSNTDLATEYLHLKSAIEQTNISTLVTIGERTHSISELIAIRRVSGKFITNTYNALNPRTATTRLQQVFNRAGGIDVSNPPKVVPAYKEEDKLRKTRDWEDFVSAIDGKLEVVNAETELLNY